jgi:molecular chaperone DnaK
MVNEAKLHEEEDKKHKEVVEQRNQLDNLIMQIEKTISENKEKLPAEEVTKVEGALEAAKTSLKENENDLDALKKAHEELMQASHKVAEILYKEEQDNAKDGENAGTKTADQTTDGEQGPIDTDAE